MKVTFEEARNTIDPIWVAYHENLGLNIPVFLAHRQFKQDVETALNQVGWTWGEYAEECVRRIHARKEAKEG